MAIAAETLTKLTLAGDTEAWQILVDAALKIARQPLAAGNATSEVTKRDREIGELDHFLSSIGWDLWESFGNPQKGGVERTSQRLIRWWAEPYSAKAVLILDGLSLRELPWLLQGAERYGFNIHEVAAYASELPGETTPFARALGLNTRSQLQNNGGGMTHKLQPTATECVDLPWEDCAGLVDGTPNWIIWHQWPDSKVHDASGAGQGGEALTRDAAEKLSAESFWKFVERMATGRRLVITSDHGYAATGIFPDAEGEVAQFLKSTFSSGRSAPGTLDPGPFAPPVAVQLDGVSGPHLLAVGRRKWRSQGGYPTMTHGGLTLLEVLSPFVVLTK